MKNYLTLMLSLLTSVIAFSQNCNQTSLDHDKTSKTEILINHHTSPIFGANSDQNDCSNTSNQTLVNFIHSRLALQSLEANQFDTNLIFVQFTVTEKGIVKNITFPRGEPLANQTNILEIFEEMPKWIPGRFMNKPIDTKMIMPIRIEID